MNLIIDLHQFWDLQAYSNIQIYQKTEHRASVKWLV